MAAVAIAEIILIAINIAMAKYHAKIFLSGRSVKHGWWGLAYIAATVVLCAVVKSWQLFVMALIIRKVFFDTSLNYFLHRSIYYVSTETTSIIDKLHYKIWGNKSMVYLPIYLMILIILNCLQAF